jgi:hypothetical protein
MMGWQVTPQLARYGFDINKILDDMWTAQDIGDVGAYKKAAEQAQRAWMELDRMMVMTFHRQEWMLDRIQAIQKEDRRGGSRNQPLLYEGGFWV